MTTKRSFASVYPAGIALALAMVLSACGDSGVTAKNESAEAVAQKVAEAGASIKMRPGKWESKLTVNSIEIPGMPPEVQKMMEQQTGQARSFTVCLTPEEANRPGEGFFQQDKDSNCTYDSFSMANGKIDAVMSCKTPEGTMKTAMQGTYKPDSYELTTEATGTMAGNQSMKMSMTVSSSRVGECDEKPDR